MFSSPNTFWNTLWIILNHFDFMTFIHTHINTHWLIPKTNTKFLFLFYALVSFWSEFKCQRIKMKKSLRAGILSKCGIFHTKSDLTNYSVYTKPSGIFHRKNHSDHWKWQICGTKNNGIHCEKSDFGEIFRICSEYRPCSYLNTKLLCNVHVYRKTKVI